MTGIPPSVDLRRMWGLVEARAQGSPDALMSSDERGVHQTFAQYRDAAESCAAGLVAQGVEPGSVVAWQLPTWIETIVLSAALARLDCTQVPLLPIYGRREIEHAVRTTGASWLVVPDQFGGRDLAAQAEEATTDLGTELLVTEGRRLPEGPVSGLPAVGGDRVPDDAVRWVFHSSGTTSDPKGILHTDGTLRAAGRAFTESARITASDRLALHFPVSHIGGVLLLFLSLDVGAANVLLARFVPEEAVAVLAREHVTLAGAGPAFLLGYLQVQRTQPGRPVLPDVRVFTSGGAPKSPALHAAVRDELGTGVGIVSNYGLTECPNATGNPPDAPDALLASSEGVANPGMELSVRGPDGASRGPGQEGELWVKGPQLCKGYVDRSLDVDAFDADGFFRTGDLVTLDDGGFLHVVGRLKDIIIRKGENISAREVEDLLELHPGVLEAVVIGLPDAAAGELCCAVVAPVDAGAAPTFDELIAHLRANGLMTQKLPERLETVTWLPRNPVGKVLKNELRERYARS